MPSLKLSNAERERITWLVANHQYLGEAEEAPRIEAQADPRRAGNRRASGAAPRRCAGVDRQYRARRLLPDTTSEMQPTGPINPPPLITGHDLVRHGLKPAPCFATLLEQIRDAQLEGVIHSKREALEWVDRQLATGAAGDRSARRGAPRNRRGQEGA